MMNKELMILLTGASPILELRGAIPLGLGLLGKEQIIRIILLSVIGNLLPVPFLLLFLMPISQGLRKISIFKRFFDWLFERTKKRADLVQRYETIGLALFVAIPLPITGAWTGSVAASLFGIRFRYAFLSITCGVIIASLIVTTLCLTGIMSWHLLK